MTARTRAVTRNQLTPEQEEKQRSLLAEAIGGHDVCISTAAIPGRTFSATGDRTGAFAT